LESLHQLEIMNKNTFPSAEEAANMCSTIESENCQEQLEELRVAIHEACKRVHRQVICYKRLLGPVETFLREKGYIVKTNTDRNETTVTITW